ncbi:MAG: type VI secretion system tip protein VgrG [Acidobacteria bacterium]|nr:type VI secretion system tip protein VgrG [Acidobacteriota bacterium]
MAKTTQDGRLMSITTPMGKDYLLVNRFTATEGLSQLFSFDVELLHEETTVSFEPTRVDPKRLLGQGVTISIAASDGSTREFTGMVNKFSQGNRDVRFSYYYIQVVPHVWLLTQKSQSRIFQQKSVPDVLKTVFAGFQVKYELQETYEPRNYCVQYRETDFDFATRLMEEEGIYYYFEHSGGTHKMIVADTPQSHRDCPGKATIPFFVKADQNQYFVGSISSFLSDSRVQTGKVTLWDYNFELPTNRLDFVQPSRFSFGDSQKLEKYDYPGGYARKYDGIDKGGGDQAGELNKVFNDREKTVKKMMESLDAQVTTATGNSDCCSITAGYRFSLINHPNNEVNKQYTIVTVTHEAEQNPAYVSNEGATEPYTNSFTCITHGAGQPPFRPLRKTPKPIVQGAQTAVVVGPGGEEIFTDKYGRVKVQFNWDREGKVNESSSCWIRVGQLWAGNKWGAMFIPRIGMEVIVHFLEGDPDQPIITGCVYNPQTMPPYTLPDEKTKSGIKTNSSKGGGGFNELRFEDKKGSEQIFIHAEKNQDIRVKNDCKETIKHDRHLTIENDQYEKVTKDKHLQVGGDHNEKIGGTMSLKVGSDLQEKVGSNYALDAGMGVHIKAGMTAVIEAGTNVTLKVGGNFVSVSPAGVTISGTMVMINSGGAAGSGAGCSPDTPKDPKPADDAQAGSATGARSAPPPPNPANFGSLSSSGGGGQQSGNQQGGASPGQSPKAAMLKQAAKKGTPFCAVCNS